MLFDELYKINFEYISISLVVNDDIFLSLYFFVFIKYRSLLANSRFISFNVDVS